MSPVRRLLCAFLALSAGANAVTDPSSRSAGVVPGVVFDRFVSIWLENVNFAAAVADPNLAKLVKQGILLENYFATTHPSQPNYVAVAGGDNFGMDNDNLTDIPANVSTIVDLLETKGITWAEYQEGLPFTGFAGFASPNPDGANNYVRKHNPLIIYNSVADVPARAANIKNFTLFAEDLQNNNLPQWMFITPNETSDGHDTNITFAGTYISQFLPPLLANPNFNTNKTLVVLTWDETGVDNVPNRVANILLGGAVPKNLIGTTDSNFYDHYSQLATVEANWNLPTLGRRDVGANVFCFVAEQTHDKIRTLVNPPLNQTFLNTSYPGPYNSVNVTSLPIPNTTLVVNGRPVLDSIRNTWGSPELQKCTPYHGSLEVPSGTNPPVLPKGCD